MNPPLVLISGVAFPQTALVLSVPVSPVRLELEPLERWVLRLRIRGSRRGRMVGRQALRIAMLDSTIVQMKMSTQFQVGSMGL